MEAAGVADADELEDAGAGDGAEPVREVAAVIAAERLLPPLPEDPATVLPPLLAVTWAAVPPANEVVRALKFWPTPDRLPRICGVTSDTKFSAEVAPLSRMVSSSRPEDAFAVRMPDPPEPEVSVGKFRR